MTRPLPQALQTLVGAGALLLGLAAGGRRAQIPSEAGYGGVGPNFLPWVVAVALTAVRRLADLGGAQRRLSRRWTSPRAPRAATGPASSGSRPACCSTRR